MRELLKRTAGVSLRLRGARPGGRTVTIPAVGRYLKRPASKGNSSTIATARKQCQRRAEDNSSDCYMHVKARRVQVRNRLISRLSGDSSIAPAPQNRTASATLPVDGLPLDAVALCLCNHRHENLGLHLLRLAQTWQRLGGPHRISRQGLLHRSEHLSLHRRACDGRSV